MQGGGGGPTGGEPEPQVHPNDPYISHIGLRSIISAYHSEKPCLVAGLHLFWSHTHTPASATTSLLDPGNHNWGHIPGNKLNSTVIDT